MKLIQLDSEQPDFSLWGYKEGLNIKHLSSSMTSSICIEELSIRLLSVLKPHMFNAR